MQGTVCVSFVIFEIIRNFIYKLVIFQGCLGGRILAPFPMEKGPVFSQKVDEISQSEASQTFSNFSV